jgi:hypothetical protein
VSDLISESWVEVNIRWGTTNQIVIGTTETLNDDERYIFTLPTLTANTNYIALCDVEENSVRLQVIPLTGDGEISYSGSIFDTATIVNEFRFPRRRGRVGWEIALGDGAAYIDAIRSRGLMFAELITNNFQSLTPVEGARLSADATEDIITVPLMGYYGNSTLAPDIYNAQSSDGSVKIISTNLTGIASNLVELEDYEHSELVFDLFFPSDALEAGYSISAVLINQYGLQMPLTLTRFGGNRWTTITAPLLPVSNQQTGSHQVALYQSGPTTGTVTWWVDNLYVRRQSVAWSGRATANDPWGRDNAWMDFKNHINSETDGIMFAHRGNWLQVRGQALTDDAVIKKVFVRPKYAELGRMVWNS